MWTSKLDERTHLSIEIALTVDQGDPALRQCQDAEAMRLGLSGAEIDAARAGRSFDVRRSRALALALSATDDGHGELRRRALQAGLDEETCGEIKRLAGTFARATVNLVNNRG